MRAAPRDITIERGVTFSMPFTWRAPRRDEQGKLVRTPGTNAIVTDPVDITGMTGHFTIRKTYDTPEAILEGTIESGNVIIEDPTTGRVVLQIPADTTRLYDFGDAVYDFELHTASGREYRLLKGVAHLELGASQ